MKKNLHPEYRPVLFHDTAVDQYFLINSTLETTQTKEWEDGKTYHISLSKHPLHHTLFTLVSKELWIQVVEFKGLRRSLVKRVNQPLYCQNLYYPVQFL